MTNPARGADTLLDLTDQDGNNLRIINAGAGKLLIDVTDENEIPVGILTDRALATEIRDALTKWIDTTTPEPRPATLWEAELRRDAGRSLCIGYCTECGHSKRLHATDGCYVGDCTCNRDQNGVAK